MEETLESQVKNLNPRVASQALLWAAIDADELEARNGLMMPKEQYIAEKTIELTADLEKIDKELTKSVQTGFSLLSEKLSNLPDERRDKFVEELTVIKERMMEVIDPLSGNLEEKAAKFLPCNNLQEIFGFSPEMMNWMYEVGRALFEEKNFSDAGGIFRILVCLNNETPNYLLGLALSEKEQQHYEGALLLFNTLTFLDPDNPLARYHSAELYLNLGQTENALTELSALLILIQAKNQPEFQPYYDALYQRATQTNQGG